MADKPGEREAGAYDLAPGGLGGWAPAEAPPPPDRGIAGFMGDMLKETASAALSIPKGIVGIKESLATSPEAKAKAREDIDTLNNLDWQLRQSRTDRAKYLDERSGGSEFSRGEIAGATGSTVAGILPYVPLGLLGPWGAIPMAGLAYGQHRADLRERIMNATPEEMANDSQYVSMVQNGMSDQEAREKLYETAASDWKAAAPTVVGNAFGGGALGLMTKGFVRSEAGDMTDRILMNLGMSTRNRVAQAGARGLEGMTFGVAQGSGTALSQQMGEVTAGLRQGVDTGEVLEHGASAGGVFGVMGAAHGAFRRIPPIGLDLESVTRMQQQGYGEPGRAVPPPPTPRTQMHEQDIAGEYGMPQAPSTAAPHFGPARPMVEDDFAMPGEYGRATYDTSTPHFGPGRPMAEADFARPGEYGHETLGEPPGPPTVDRARVMDVGDIYPDVERVGQQYKQPLGPGERMVVGPHEYGEQREPGRMPGQPWVKMRPREVQPVEKGTRQFPGGFGPFEYGPEITRRRQPRVPAREMMITGEDIAERRTPGGYDYGHLLEPEMAERPTTARYVPPPGEGSFYQGPPREPPPRGGGGGAPPRGGPPPSQPPGGGGAAAARGRRAREGFSTEQRREQERLNALGPEGRAREYTDEQLADLIHRSELGAQRMDVGARDTRFDDAHRAHYAKQAADLREAVRIWKAEQDRRAGFEVGGYPQEPVRTKLDWRDRKTIEKLATTLDANTRGRMSDALQRMLDRGETPSLKRMPEMGDVPDHIENLLAQSPQDVINAIRGNVERAAGKELNAGEHDTLQRVMDRATPEERKTWADKIDELAKKGQKPDWAKMPSSFRKALGDDRAAAIEALRKNPREAADKFAGREHAPEAPTYRDRGDVPDRETVAAETSEAVPTEERPPSHAQVEEPVQEFQKRRQEEAADVEAPLRQEYGPSVEPREGAGPEGARSLSPEHIVATSLRHIAPEPKLHLKKGIKLQAVQERVRTAEKARSAKEVQRQNLRSRTAEQIEEEAAQPETRYERQQRLTQERQAAEATAEREAAEGVAQARAAAAAERKVVEAAEAAFTGWFPTVDMLRKYARMVETVKKLAKKSDFYTERLAELAARKTRRRERASKYMQTKREREYRAREDAIKQAFENPELQLDKTFEELGKPGMTLQKFLDDLVLPAGDVKLQGEKGKSVPYGATLPIDSETREALHQTGRDLIAYMKARVVTAQQVVDAARVRYQARKGGLKSDIGAWRIGRQPTGKYPWFDRAATYNQQAAQFKSAMEQGTNLTLRNLIIDFYIRERMFGDSRFDEWQQYVKEQRDRSLATMRDQISKNVRYIEDQRWYAEQMRLNRERLEAMGSKKGTDPLRQEMARLTHVIDTAGVEAARARNNKLQQEIDLLNAMYGDEEHYSGGKMNDQQLVNWADIWTQNQDEHAEYNKRRQALEWMAQQYLHIPKDEQARLERMTPEERRKALAEREQMPEALRRELDRMEKEHEARMVQRAEDIAAASHEKVTPARRPETMAEVQKRLQPKSEREVRERIAWIDQRLNTLMSALEELPADRLADPRTTGDTLEYYLSQDATPDRIDWLHTPSEGPLQYPERVERLVREIEDEAAALQAEMRHYAEQRVPGMREREYGVRRIFDPSVDLRDTRNLPRGASVFRVADFLGLTERSIRETGNALRNHFFDVVEHTMGDVDVVALTNEQMYLARQLRGVDPEALAFYDVGAHRILITHEALNGPDRGRILGHEFAHPLTEVAIERFPHIGERLDAIRQMALDEWLKPAQHELLGGGVSDVRRILGDIRPSALDNVHEFVAELFNDGGKLATALEQMWVSPEKRAALETEKTLATRVQEFTRARPGERAPFRQRPSVLEPSRMTLMQRVLQTLQEGFRRLFTATGRLRTRALTDAVIHSMDLFQHMTELGPGKRARGIEGVLARPITARDIRDKVEDLGDAVRFHTTDKAGFAGRFLKWHTLNELGRRLEPGFQEVTKPFESIIGRVWTRAREINEVAKGYDIARRLAEQKRMPAARFDELQDYIDKENYAQVDGSVPLSDAKNAWVAGRHDEAQLRSRHAELAAAWARLSPDQKALRNEIKNYVTERHAQIKRADVQRLVEAKRFSTDEATNKAITKYVLEETLSAPEQALVDAVRNPDFDKYVKQVRKMPAFRKIPGVWYPMMRKGQWAVEGVFNLLSHAKAIANSAEEVGRGVMQFDTPEQREAFRQRIEAHPRLRDMKHLSTRDVDVGGTTKYRIEYNPLFLEFHDNRRHAFERHRELQTAYGSDMKLAAEPLREDLTRWMDPNRLDAGVQRVLKSIEQSEGFRDLDATSQSMLRRDILEAHARHMMSTSARDNYLPRKYALGARNDLIRNFVEYSKNTSMTLAELEHRGEMQRALKAMDKYIADRKFSASPGDPQNKYNALRMQIANQIKRRIEERPNETASPFWKNAINRVLQLSYMDKLISPGFWLVNSTEPWLLGAPLLAGEHGFKSYAAIGRAYRDVGAGHLLGTGFRDAYNVLKAGVGGDPVLTDAMKFIKDRLSGTDRQLIEYLEREGYLDRDAGMEMERLYTFPSNPIVRAYTSTADWGDHASRQVNQQIENINRATIGLASYRLARDKGMGHEKALEYAKDKVHDTAGNYALYAAPEAFRNPWLRPALQFKRYAQRITANYVRMVAGAIQGDTTKMKQLAFMVASQTAVAGVTGLPTEPLKAVVFALNKAGVIDFNWTQVENGAREMLASATGSPEAAQYLLYGLPQAFDIGIGSRVSHGDLWTFGQMGDRPADWLQTAGHLAGGAPLAYGVDFVEGLGHGKKWLEYSSRGFDTAADREGEQALVKLLPIKVAADVIQSYSRATGGFYATTPTGQPTGYAPTTRQTVQEALGMRTAQSQEADRFRDIVRRREQVFTDRRNELYNAFSVAQTPAERDRVWQDTKRVNETLPPDLKITRSDLAAARGRREKRAAQPPAFAGLPVTRRQQALLPPPGLYQTGGP